jgi:hypothetical protein
MEIQHTYNLIAEAMTGVAIAAQVFLLAFMSVAFIRYRHHSFLLLCFGSLCGVASASLGALYFIFPTNLASTLSRLEVRSVLYVLSAAFGLWGTVSLVNSYKALFNRATVPAKERA